MQHTFTLAAWNFRLARRYLLALWGIFAAQQAAVILWRAAQQGSAGLGLASHYYATMQIFAYLGFYLLTALEVGLATHNSRRARSGYTWATLPGTPGQKLAAKAITIAAAELVFAAWQFVWYIVEFYPVTALESWHRRQMYGAVLPAASLYEQVVANNLFARLLPRRPAQIVILLGILALSAAMLAALDTVRGWRKLPVFAGGLFCAWVCFGIVSIERHLEWLLDEPRYAFRIAAAVVLAVLTVWWAVRSIRRGEAA